MHRSAMVLFGWGFVTCFLPTLTVAQTNVPVPDIVLRGPPSLGDVFVPEIVLVTPPPVGAVAVSDITLVTRPPLGKISLPPIVLVSLTPNGDVPLPDIVLITPPPRRDVAIGLPDIILVTDDDEEEDETDSRIGSGGSPATGRSLPVLGGGKEIPEPMDQGRTWCGGTYSVQLGQPRVIPAGPSIGRAETATATVSSTQCTSIMNIEVNGISVAMTRTLDAEHVGAATGDGGQIVTFYLTCNADLGITGHMQAEDANIKIQRNIEMTRTGGSGPDLSSCHLDANFTARP